MIDKIIVLILLIILSGFFSAIETAFTTLTNFRVIHLLEQKKKGAELIKRLKDDYETLINTILVGNNIVNIGASALATTMVLDFFTAYDLPFRNPVALTTGLMTLVVLIFGEITPKTIAANNAEKICFASAKLVNFLVVILSPITKILTIITKKLAKSAGKTMKPIITEAELKTMIRIGENIGEINPLERKMIHNLFNFDTISVDQVMIPRHDMYCVEANKQLSEIIATICNKGYSRIPVYEKNKDKIIGVLYVKDILKQLYKKRINVTVKQMMSEVFFVPETKKIDALLSEFKRRKQHMAIVVDEHGLVIGSITIEDVLEEIVGDIMDETDTDEENIQKIKTNEWLIQGKAEIKNLNKKLHLEIPENPEYDTLAGYVLFKAGRIPKKGELITDGNLNCIITDKKGQRINKVKVTIKQ